MANIKSTVITGTGAVKLAKGTTGERPGSPSAGAARYNSSLGYSEVYNGTSWVALNPTKVGYNNALHSGPAVISQNGPYKIHTFNFHRTYTDFSESTTVSSDANWKVMKTFTATHTGTISIRFTAKIISGSYYYGYRIRQNATNTLQSSGYGSNLWGDPFGTYVHNYKRYRVLNLSVTAGDSITIEMASTSGDNTNVVTGNGQTLYCKDVMVDYYGYTFVPTMSGNVEVLAVAGGGGGGGGGYGGGGGGAGGVIYRSAYPVVAGTSYTITVGDRGYGGKFGGVNTGFPGSSGENSVFDTLTAVGGGGGGAYNTTTSYGAGGNGGSGGGGGSISTYGTAGTGTVGQGFAGGAGINAAQDPAGGGGGAGGPGETAFNGHGGDGGPGLCFDISGEPKWYAGGGGGGCYATYGGAGSAGGGGKATVSNARIDAEFGAYGTGSGGGGGSNGATIGSCGGEGGTGVVIVRYLSTSPASVANSYTNPGTYYWYAPTGVSKIELLVVGGGGGGGTGTGGGGGGAGGVVYTTSYPVTAGNKYVVTVGAGGSASPSNATQATNGGNSVFDIITAYGGGYGGNESATTGWRNGNTGGSGGGGTYNGSGGGITTNSQGNSGGNGTSGTSGAVNWWGGGGGGGAGNNSIGQNAVLEFGNYDSSGASTYGSAGNGGAGVCIGISGVATWYGGGGGGSNQNNTATWTTKPGYGGVGGGGDGGNDPTSTTNANGKSGLPNTGGGGGGAGDVGLGGDGGSGVVIIRYNP
jgi:hypothetical protein